MDPAARRRGVFLPPPWVRVVAVDPVTLDPVPAGHEGIARILDLANVDSAVAVQTADRVVVTSGVAAGEPVVVRGAFTLKSELGKAAFGDDD